ncbi:hypothetical protein [Streptoalloteichus tenebrarius]|uniref:hypothetical protein n=1 Tax=Streptoalloteichus tenebrarius (strain ATCC 17920 / DSM 40477 / JCM 4838 / CBS 697.72 / NBRC 16177 / NCIMB 11028 / NRRL B-12390 / A12253. 1 / ISP 5477) TaxID=1933 RepID=UPI0020A292C9|nr:hypothetical protein [Streptoalloteichus tenebrarius]
MVGTGRRHRLGWRARRAIRAATLLDRVVDSQLPLVTGLPEASRRHSADYLAELVMLAQAYRHYAAGWIDRRELDRRGRAAVARLDQLRRERPSASPEQLTEQD